MITMKREDAKVGLRVTTSGYPGTITGIYSPGMVEIRLERGAVCVCVSDVEPEQEN